MAPNSIAHLVETDAGPLQPLEASHHQAAANQQDRGERSLKDDGTAPQALQTAAVTERAGGLGRTG